MPDDLSGLCDEFEAALHGDCELTPTERRDLEVAHLRYLFRVRRICFRARLAMIFLLGVAFPLMPWFMLIVPITVTIMMVTGLRGDLRAMAGFTARIADLTPPAAQGVYR
jgi:hypothetical protein